MKGTPPPLSIWPPSRHVARKTLCQHPVGRGHNATLTIGPRECARTQSKGHQRRELPPPPSLPFLPSVYPGAWHRAQPQQAAAEYRNYVNCPAGMGGAPTERASSVRSGLATLITGHDLRGRGRLLLPLHHRALVGVVPVVPSYVTP